MSLTKSFKELVQTRISSDPDFAAALLRESVDTMLSGDVETGKAILRDYIQATVGFEALGEAIGTAPQTLTRMLGARGDPHARSLFAIISFLQKKAGLQLHVLVGSGQAR